MNTSSALTSQQILTAVDKLASGRLHSINDLERLIELALTNNKLSLLEELSFHAKFSNSLLSIIQKKDSIIDEQYFTKAANEYKESIQKVIFLLKQLLEFSNDFLKSIFNEKYFQLTQECLSNLSALCSDLSLLKLFFNDLKSGSIQR